jgi:hypothetical protein
MMMVMTGKRLAAAGALVAAVAATAALWVVPHATLSSQLRAGQLRTIRHAQSAVTTTVAHLRAPVAPPTPQSLMTSPVGLVVTVGVLFALVLVGVAPRQRRRAVPVTVRSPHRGRAPPSPRAHHHTARIRDH